MRPPIDPALLVCPKCRGELTTQPRQLTCPSCRIVFPVVDGIPRMVPEEWTRQRR